MTSTQEEGNVEFFPRTPLYNDRVIPLSIITLLPLIPAFGSFPVAVVALVGITSTYIADIMNFRKTTIALLIATLISIWFGFYLGNIVEIWSSVSSFVVLLNAALLMCLLAVWSLVHVRWFVLKFAEVAVRMERAVVGLLPFAALPSIVSTCTALAGSRHASFVIAISLVLMHWLFFWRRSSSFAILTSAALLSGHHSSHSHGGDSAAASAVGDESSANNNTQQQHQQQPQNQQTEKQKREIRDTCFVVHKPETFMFSILTLILPMVLHFCFVYPTISKTMITASASHYSRWLLLVNCAGLVFIPTAYFLFFYKRALWFLREDFPQIYHKIEKQRQNLGIASYALGMIFLISRVLHSRYAYLFSGFVPPFNFFMLLAIAAAFPVLVVLSKEIYYNSIETMTNKSKTPESVKKLWGTCLGLSVLITVAFCMALGMLPFFVMTSACAVSALWAYLIDRRRNAGQYTMFMFCSAIALLWWMFNSFSFIVSDFKVFGEVGVIPAPLLAGSMLWVYIFGTWLIPLSFQKEAKFLFTVVLVFHSQKILWIERVLYSQNEENTYPPQFVFLTSIIGSLAAYKLFQNEILEAGAASIVVGAYLSKLAVYFSDSVEIDYRWSDGTSPWAMVRETFVAYSGWASVSLILYANMKFKLGTNLSSNLKDSQKDSMDLVDNIDADDIDHSQTQNKTSTENSTEKSKEKQQDLSEKDKEYLRRMTLFTAANLSVNLYLFFFAATPTLIRWFIEDILRVPSPSRMQLFACAAVFGSATSWYYLNQIIYQNPFYSSSSSTSNKKSDDENEETSSAAASSSSSFTTTTSNNKVHRLFAGLTLIFLAMSLLDPPVEALVSDVFASSSSENDDFDNHHAAGSNYDDYPTYGDAGHARRQQHLLLPDLPFQAPWWSRWALLISLSFAIFLRGLLSSSAGNFNLSGPIRLALWTFLGLMLGFAVTGCNIIIADWKVYLVFCIYFIFTLLCFDQAHYNKLENTEILITLFIASLISFVIGIFLLNQVDVFAVTKTEAYLIDGVFASRVGAIGVLAVVSFAFAAALKCRIHNFSLMPRPAKIETVDGLSQLSLVLSAWCALGAVSLILLALLLGSGSTPLILMAGGVLLLVDDKGWGFGLDRGLRRYVLPFLVVSFCLWIRAVQEYRTVKTLGDKANTLPYYVGAALLVPSQVIVTFVLWRGGSSDPNTSRNAAKTARGIFALILLAIDLVVVILTISPNLRLLAALNLIGHITRLSLLEGIIAKAKGTLFM